MYVSALKLNNFRNYKALTAELSPGINVLFGRNAQGKTNILEAVYYLAFGKSFRGSKNTEAIHWAEGAEPQPELAFIEGVLHKMTGELTVKERLHKTAKELYINNTRLQRLGQLVGNMNLVLFSPEDMALVENPTALRRKFADSGISQLNVRYLQDLVAYNRALKQRNNQLRNMKPGAWGAENILAIWDMQLARYQSRIIAERREFIVNLNRYAGEVHLMLSEGSEKLRIVYEPDMPIEGESAILQAYEGNRRRDIYRQMTVSGCHRDNYSFEINGKKAEKFGSQGQKRTLVLSLKLALMRLLKESTGESPILLLDDVTGELDTFRRERLLTAIRGSQVFVTTAELQEGFLQELGACSLYHVVNGSLTLQNNE